MSPVMRQKIKWRLTVLVLWGLVLAVAIGDAITPLGFAHGFMYVPVILTVAIYGNGPLLRWTSAVSAVLVMAGVLWSQEIYSDTIPFTIVVSHRLLALAVLTVVYLLLERYLQLQHRLVKEREENEFRRLANNLPILVWTANAQGKVNYYADPVLDYTGLTEKQLLQQWTELIHPEDRRQTERKWQFATETETDFQTEFRLKESSGDYQWFLVRAKPVYNREGALVKWYGSGINISQLKELQRKSLNQAKRYYNVLESISDGFFTINDKYCFNYVNGRAGQMLGGDDSKLLGKPVWLASTPLSEELFNPIQSAMLKQETVTFTHLQEDNSVSLEVTVSPSLGGASVYLRDITEARELQQQLAHAQRIDSLGHLTGGVAHDFNNLLTVIVGNADLLIKQLSPEFIGLENRAGEQRALLTKLAKLQRLAHLVLDAAERGVSVTQSLLAFSRRQKLQPNVIDLNQLLRDLEYLLSTTLGGQHELSVVLESEPVCVHVDASQLENVLINLTINARDAMHQSGKVTISVSAIKIDSAALPEHKSLKPDYYALIEVADTGEGIAEATRHRIFEPFFTTKETGKGTGLGLSTAYGFLKQSGGHLSVSSRVGEGSVFRLYLPASRKSRPLQLSTNTSFRDPAQGAGERILLVEDDSLVRTYAAQALEDAGYHVFATDTGDKALTILQGDREFDLIFSDIVMPGAINGIDLAEQAAKLRPTTPVLLTSGYADTAGRGRPELHQHHDLLEKPYKAADLLRRIKSLLRKTTQTIR